MRHKGNSSEEEAHLEAAAAVASSSAAAALAAPAPAKEEAAAAQWAVQGGASGQPQLGDDEGLEEGTNEEGLRLLLQRERQSSGCSPLSTSSPHKVGPGADGWPSFVEYCTAMSSMRKASCNNAACWAIKLPLWQHAWSAST